MCMWYDNHLFHIFYLRLSCHIVQGLFMWLREPNWTHPEDSYLKGEFKIE